MSLSPVPSSNSSSSMSSGSSSSIGAMSVDVKENKLDAPLIPPPIPHVEVLDPKDLNPYFHSNAAKDYRDQSCRAKLLKAAAILSVIFYVALAALATVLVTLWAPTFLPFVAVATLALMFPMYQLFQYIWQKALAQQFLADFNGGVTKELKQLNTPEAVKTSLENLGIPQNTSIDPKRYAEVIARYNHYSNAAEKVGEDLEKLAEKIAELGKQHAADSDRVRRDLVVKSYDHDQQKAQEKLRAAWMLNILKTPKDQRLLETIGRFKIETADNRALDDLPYNPDSIQNDSDDIFVFNDATLESLTLDQIKEKEIEEIADLLANPPKVGQPDANPADVD